MTVLREDAVFVGAAAGAPQHLRLDRANRHGLVTGATGTGKTVTLQILAEGFSAAGVPTFCADIKGDLSGIAVAGEPKDVIVKRAEAIGLGADLSFRGAPTVFWDLAGVAGHPLRTTVSEMGPLLLGRLFGLTAVQEGVLAVAFRVADEEGLALLDLKDLRALLTHVAEDAKAISAKYGRVAPASVTAIQRAVLALEAEGGDRFFGEPAFDIADLIRTDEAGRGVVNVLVADTLMERPKLYATFLLWLLSELFEALPEVGDPDKPTLVFFFDEAHLLFDDAPKPLLEAVERVVRLVRSKGVGVFFVTQNPLDVPETVLGQLGNRLQHALRAYTPRERKAVKAAAETFRPNPALDTERVITELGVGEALVSTLDEKGVPTVVERTLIRPPEGRIGPITPAERAVLVGASPLGAKYAQTVDRESAYERLTARAEAAAKAAKAAPAEGGGWWGGARGGAKASAAQKAVRSTGATVAAEIGARVGRSVAGSMGASIGRSIARGVFGTLLRR